MYKLASQAVSWYNEGLNIDIPQALQVLTGQVRETCDGGRSMYSIVSPLELFPQLETCSVCQQEKHVSHFIHKYMAQGQWLCVNCAAVGKHCSTCKDYKLNKYFVKATHATNRNGVSSQCKVCRRSDRRATYKITGKTEKQKYQERAAYLKRKFNISYDAYYEMHEHQQGLCASCGQPETFKDRRSGTLQVLAVDHDHETGEIRALLCRDCNVALGYMRENPKRIRQLADYAEKWQ